MRAMLLVPDRPQDVYSTVVFLEYVSLQDLHTLGDTHELFIVISEAGVIHIVQTGKQMHQGLAFRRKVFQNLSPWLAFVLFS